MAFQLSITYRKTLACMLFLLFTLTIAAPPAAALDGMLRIHDPSTVIICAGHYYVFGTGRGIPILSSSDGFTWQRAGRVFEQIPEAVKSLVPKNDGRMVWAPDIIYVNGQYLLYYSVSTWGSPVSAIAVMTNPTLDPANPKYQWADGGLIVRSGVGDDLNTIDPGVLHAPDGTLWLSYGSYIGNIQLVQLDPKTGRRSAPNSPVWIIASHSEASDIIFHDGYYYLLVNHGSCCKGKDSTYNIRMGRSRKLTGPYLDRNGQDMARGAGTLFLATQGNQIGPGHFGRLVDDGVEKFSCHYEADTDHGNYPVLDIRPLLWTADGWAAPGAQLKEGLYQILSQASREVLQAPADGTAPGLGKYRAQDSQKWIVAPAGGGLYKITAVPKSTALELADAAAGQTEATPAVAAYTGAANQLWKIDQLPDGTYRLACKANKLALTLKANPQPPNALVAKAFDGDTRQRWLLTAP